MKLPKVKFVFDRRHRATANNEGTVEIRVTHDYRQKFLSTGIRLLPSQWDERAECVKKRPDAIVLNATLAEMKSTTVNILSKMVSEGMIDLERIKKELELKSADKTFLEYIEMRTSQRQVSANTRDRYTTLLATLRRFGKITLYSDITETNIRNFDEWLHSQTVNGKPYKQSTVHFYHKTLKVFINDALMDGYVQANPYQSRRIHIDKGESLHIQCLTQEQVTQIEELEMPNRHLSNVKDLFLFQCYTGLSYSDLMKFRVKDCVVLEDGTHVVNDKRTKTNVGYTFVLSPKALEILKRHKNKLPYLSNQKYNDYLKVIGNLINVPNLHSHMGRSSFASICLNNGMPMEIIKETLGHRSQLMTERYATVRQETIIQAFKDIFNKKS